MMIASDEANFPLAVFHFQLDNVVLGHQFDDFSDIFNFHKKSTQQSALGLQLFFCLSCAFL
jgi:hypothetical protein